MDSALFASTFATTYSRLLQGSTPEQLAGPNQDVQRFWDGLLNLKVDRVFLSSRLNDLRKDDCLNRLKPVLNDIFGACIRALGSQRVGDEVPKRHAAATLGVLSRSLLSKNLAGWEVMEVFAGGVRESDRTFKNLITAIDDTLRSTSASGTLRHEILQVAVTFVCGISQLSPGAYFLQHDLFPCIVDTINSPDTEQFTFEAVLLLALLANYHKSDAAKLNPYLRRIRETDNEAMMCTICSATNFTTYQVIKTYQSILDDSPPTLSRTLGSFLSSLRPDLALVSKSVNSTQESFKSQPNEACVVLLPLYEFLHGNYTFCRVFARTLIKRDGEKVEIKITPLPLTLLSLSSYLLSHASSSSSPRALAYANLALNILLVMVENDDIMAALRETSQEDVRLCRQRQPPLPLTSPRAPLCALLDCCILWLRHNLQKRLEVYSHITCVRICYRVLWYLQKEHIRLEYHWQELWQAIILLLNFLASKLDSLATTGGIELLVQEALLVVDLALCRNERLLPSPKVVHELVYEVVRSADIFRRQRALLEKLANPRSTSSQKRLSGMESRAAQALVNITAVAEHYETKLREAGVRSANQGMRAVAKELEKDGLSHEKDVHGTDDPPRAENVVGAIRFVYADGMSLMP